MPLGRLARQRASALVEMQSYEKSQQSYEKTQKGYEVMQKANDKMQSAKDKKQSYEKQKSYDQLKGYEKMQKGYEKQKGYEVMQKANDKMQSYEKMQSYAKMQSYEKSQQSYEKKQKGYEVMQKAKGKMPIVKPASERRRRSTIATRKMQSCGYSCRHSVVVVVGVHDVGRKAVSALAWARCHRRQVVPASREIGPLAPSTNLCRAACARTVVGRRGVLQDTSHAATAASRCAR